MTDSVLSELKALEDAALNSPTGCALVRNASAVLEEDAFNYLMGLVGGDLVAVTKIVEVLRKAGIKTSKETISAHRRKSCVCYDGE